MVEVVNFQVHRIELKDGRVGDNFLGMNRYSRRIYTLKVIDELAVAMGQEW